MTPDETPDRWARLRQDVSNSLTERDAAVSRADTLAAAIRSHREAVKCCEECASAVAEDRSTDDGRLWAALPPEEPA